MDIFYAQNIMDDANSQPGLILLGWVYQSPFEKDLVDILLTFKTLIGSNSLLDINDIDSPLSDSELMFINRQRYNKIMSKKSKPNRRTKKVHQELPSIVYIWIIGLTVIGYVVGRIGLDAYPHPYHWLSGLGGAILGYYIGRLWYRWRGDIM